MPTLSDIFNLDPNVERLTLLPRLRGSLPSEKSVMMPDRYMFDVIAPKFIYDFIRAVKSPGRAAKGEALDEEEALNTAMNMFGGGLATSGSVPLGALGMSARTAPAGSIPLREVPRSPLGFYSKVEEATLPLQNKGSGSQFLAQIQKTPGVKPEEIEVLGLDKFLQSKPTVTKQEIQDYITANKPDVQEVRLGQGTVKSFEQWAADQGFGPEAIRDFGPTLRNSYEAFKENASQKVGAAKFSQYTIPGGENYRELLLTLPVKEERVFPTIQEWHDKTHVRPFSEVQQNPRLLEIAQRQYERDKSAFVRNPNVYYSSHFQGQPNILTHLRANDRVIDGKKALFIEEIQSDWHQAGRKKGYQRKKDLTPEEIDLKFIRSEVPPGADPSVYPGYYEAFDKSTGQFLGRHSGTLNREQAMRDAVMSANQFQTGVPDAPFKKSWHELALKRAIQEAVDKGYDKLAFTTGKTQAERYALSKQIDAVKATKQPDGLYSIEAYKDDAALGRGRNPLIEKNNLTAEELENTIGKELARKIVSDVSGDSLTKTYSGVDLDIGGEGMKGFYDEILPKALQNLTKKYGTKVTKTKLDARGEDKLSTKLRENGYDPYNADLQQILTDNGGRQPRWLNDTDMTALELGYTPSLKDTGVEVWSMDITPQMREQVKAKGQPLFATAPPLGLATQDPLEQFLGYQEAQNDPLMQFLGYK